MSRGAGDGVPFEKMFEAFITDKIEPLLSKHGLVRTWLYPPPTPLPFAYLCWMPRYSTGHPSAFSP